MDWVILYRLPDTQKCEIIAIDDNTDEIINLILNLFSY